MPRSMRSTLASPQLRAMSVAFDDHGETGAEARQHEQHRPVRFAVGCRAVGQELGEHARLVLVEGRGQRGEMHEARIDLDGFGERLGAATRGASRPGTGRAQSRPAA
jgi:hypothetical protein